MKFSELVELLEDARLEGEDCELESIALAGEAAGNQTAISFDAPVSEMQRVIVEHDVSVKGADTILRVKHLNEQLPVILSAIEKKPSRQGIEENSWQAEDFLYKKPVYIGAGSWIGPRVKFGKNVRIDPNVIIKGDTLLGDNVYLHSGVCIESPARIGAGTVIHANTVIGADGYGYRQKDGRHHKVPQVGGVVIGADVEIGALCTVDRGTITDTEIGAGSKLDDQIHIAHNCKMGKHCLMAGKSGLSGSVTLGDYVVLGGFAAVTDHVSITDRVTIAGRAGVTKDITEPGITVSGFPARPHREELRFQVHQRRVPQLRDKIKRLEKRLEQLVEESEER
ncbi:MAG: UDP-3-O-(3-hydroxymyristoyl)glucosamine N-acyltransferase [bacterium]